MRRIVSWIAVLALCFALVLPARADSPYPPSQGIVTDLAGVLGDETARDLQTLAERMNGASLGRIYVVTRHFLGGTDASDYAGKLFEAWQLNSDDVLLLMVVGEEKAALHAGDAVRSALPADTRTSLLANHFRDQFLKRNYNEAAAELCTQVCAVLCKTEGRIVSTAGLFGTSGVQATAKPQSASSASSSSSSIWNSMFSLEDYEEEDDWPIDARYSSHSSFNWRGWLIWGLVIYFLFFRKKGRKRYDFSHGPRQRK